jgi:hypothetical protein
VQKTWRIFGANRDVSRIWQLCGSAGAYFFGDYPFDSNPATTGRLFWLFRCMMSNGVGPWLHRIFSTREKISKQKAISSAVLQKQKNRKPYENVPERCREIMLFEEKPIHPLTWLICPPTRILSPGVQASLARN